MAPCSSQGSACRVAPFENGGPAPAQAAAVPDATGPAVPSCIPVSPGGTCPVFILQWTRQQAFYPRHPRTLQILLLERQLVDQVPPLLKISARNDAILNNSASTCSRILAMLMWEPAARRVIVHRQQQIIAVRDLGAAISTAGADFSRPWEKLTPRQHEGPQCYYLWPPSLSDQRAQLRPRGSHNDLLQVVGCYNKCAAL